MKLRISFFNPGVLKKDATRFFPVWGLYSILLLILYFMLTDSAVGAGELAYNMVDMIPISAIINLCYGLLCAFMLFGDLFNSRLCNALHAMPMRREGWFVTHLTAGLLFMAVPNGLFALITGLQMESYAYISLWWLATACMQFLFFFGVGVLAMLCAGNRLGAAALYCIFNFLPVLIYVLFESFYLPSLPGIVNDWDNYAAFTPVYKMASADYLEYHHMSGYKFTITEAFPQDFGYVGICAGAGVIALILALFVYRKRKLESAGDLLSVKSLKYLFLPVCTYGMGALFYLMGELIISQLQHVMLLIGLVVGFFAGQMLLDKSVKVFHGKTILALGVMILFLLGSMALTSLDPLGITRYVPDAQQVQTVSLLSRWEGEAHLTAASDIKTVIDIHKDQIGNNNDGNYNTYPYTIRYTLNNNKEVSRSYNIILTPETKSSLRDIFSRWESIFSAKDAESLLPMIDTVSVSGYQLSKEEIEPLVKAMEKDCQDGKMAQFSLLQEEYDTKMWVEIKLKDRANYGTSYISVQIFSGCENTLPLIEKYDEKELSLDYEKVLLD